MGKVINFFSKHPMVLWLSIGFILGGAISIYVSKQADKTIKEYKEINKLVIEEYKSKYEEQNSKIVKLSEENKRLSGTIKTSKIVKPDGTIKETTESTVESEESAVSTIKEEYYKRSQEEVSAISKLYQEKIDKLLTERKKLTITGGVTTDLTDINYFILGTYIFSGPFSVSAGSTLNPFECMLGFGFNF